MLLLNAMDDPIVPQELHYIPRQFACTSHTAVVCALLYAADIDMYTACVMQ